MAALYYFITATRLRFSLLTVFTHRRNLQRELIQDSVVHVNKENRVMPTTTRAPMIG
jgi:hypothetical protein